MPNKYEREIEEILRNLDRADQGQSFGERIRAFNRPPKRTRLAGPRWRLRMNTHTAWLVLGIALAFVGAGIAYYFSQPTDGLWAYVGGGIGVASFVCLLVGLAVGWGARFGRGATAGAWRGERISRTRTFRPFALITTQFRIMRLKWRYWRTRGR
jgi:hypothetical protein